MRAKFGSSLAVPLVGPPGQEGEKKRKLYVRNARHTWHESRNDSSSPPAPLTNILSADTLVLRRYPTKGFSKVALTSIGDNLAAPTFPERIFRAERDIWATGWPNEEIFRVSTLPPLSSLPPSSASRGSFIVQLVSRVRGESRV